MICGRGELGLLTGRARVLCALRPGRAAARHRGQDEHHRAHRLRHRHRSHEAGYVVKYKDGGRNRYQIQGRLPLSGAGGDGGIRDGALRPPPPGQD